MPDDFVPWYPTAWAPAVPGDLLIAVDDNGPPVEVDDRGPRLEGDLAACGQVSNGYARASAGWGGVAYEDLRLDSADVTQHAASTGGEPGADGPGEGPDATAAGDVGASAEGGSV